MPPPPLISPQAVPPDDGLRMFGREDFVRTSPDSVVSHEDPKRHHLSARTTQVSTNTTRHHASHASPRTYLDCFRACLECPPHSQELAFAKQSRRARVQQQLRVLSGVTTGTLLI